MKTSNALRAVFFPRYSTDEIKSLIELDKEDGYSLLESLAFAKKAATFFDEIVSFLNKDESLLAELSKEDGKKKEVYGVELAVSSSTRYDYSSVPAWQRFKVDADKVSEKLKHIETLSKSCKSIYEVTDEDTGEQLIVTPCVKTSTDLVKCTIKKQKTW
jgi:hypothetical protein